MSDIMLDFEKLQSEVIETNQQVIGNLQDALASAQNAINGLTSKGWSGKAQAAFATKFANYQNDTIVLHGGIDRYIEALKSIGQEGSDMVQEKDRNAQKTL